MKLHSIDLRGLSVPLEKRYSFRKVALSASEVNRVERWVTQKRTEGYVVLAAGGSVSTAMEHKQLMTIFEQQPDATLAEYCELLFDATGRASYLCVGRSSD